MGIGQAGRQAGKQTNRQTNRQTNGSQHQLMLSYDRVGGIITTMKALQKSITLSVGVAFLKTIQQKPLPINQF